MATVASIDIEGAKIDCLCLFMCPLLAQLKIGFFSSFSDVAVYNTNEANKAGLKQSIIFRCLWYLANRLESCYINKKIHFWSFDVTNFSRFSTLPEMSISKS